VVLLFSEQLVSFWTQIYKITTVDESVLFPMVTPADGDSIRPYFNAGLLVVRPEAKILRKWAEYYERLYNDTLLRKLCKMDVRKRIFLHQTALTGAILNHLTKDEIIELSDCYNYPVFFREQFGAKKDFHNITRMVTFRHESYFSIPDTDWEKKLTGSPEKIEWIKEHLLD
jgi:lipopolysaccharide biosynthesis glycosyltransferase